MFVRECDGTLLWGEGEESDGAVVPADSRRRKRERQRTRCTHKLYGVCNLCHLLLILHMGKCSFVSAIRKEMECREENEGGFTCVCGEKMGVCIECVSEREKKDMGGYS